MAETTLDLYPEVEQLVIKYLKIRPIYFHDIVTILYRNYKISPEKVKEVVVNLRKKDKIGLNDFAQIELI